ADRGALLCHRPAGAALLDAVPRLRLVAGRGGDAAVAGHVQPAADGPVAVRALRGAGNHPGAHEPACRAEPAVSDFDYSQLDEIIHSRIRQAVMAILAGEAKDQFTNNTDTADATDGYHSPNPLHMEHAGIVT